MCYASNVEGWYKPAWEFRYKITIERRKEFFIANGSFPLYLKVKDARLKWSDNGGHVAQKDGQDFVFLVLK